MNKFIVISACYEIGRYGHDKSTRQTADAHGMGKLTKFVITPHDLIDSAKPPTTDNFRFEACQIDAPDVVLYAGVNTTTVLKGARFLASSILIRSDLYEDVQGRIYRAFEGHQSKGRH